MTKSEEDYRPGARRAERYRNKPSEGVRLVDFKKTPRLRSCVEMLQRFRHPVDNTHTNEEFYFFPSLM